MQNERPTFTTMQKVLAWGVHIFTASGVVFSLLAIIAIADHEFVMSMVWLICAFIVDGVDGIMARKARVTEVLPFMEGKNIDFVIDFANYAIIPGYFMYEAFWMVNGEKVYMLPEPEWIRFSAVAMVMLVSAVYYGKEPMVSEDMYFIGFPVMWNAVAYFMFFVVQPSAWINFGLIVMFAILHFVPLKYAYPSQNKRFQILNWTMGLVFLVSNAYLLWIYPEQPMWLRIIAGLFLPYILWNTLWVSFKK